MGGHCVRDVLQSLANYTHIIVYCVHNNVYYYLLVITFTYSYRCSAVNAIILACLIIIQIQRYDFNNVALRCIL